MTDGYGTGRPVNGNTRPRPSTGDGSQQPYVGAFGCSIKDLMDLRHEAHHSPALISCRFSDRSAGSPEGEVAKRPNEERMREVQSASRGTQEIYKKSKSNGSVHIVLSTNPPKHSAFEVKLQRGSKLMINMRGNFRVCNLSVAVFCAVEDSPAQQLLCRGISRGADMVAVIACQNTS